MKILVNSFIILAGAGLGFVVGFALRSKPATVTHTVMEISDTNSRSSTNFNTRSSFLANRRTVIRTDDSPLATKLERDLSMSSGVTRWLYWLEALEKAAPSDCPRLARLAYGNSTLVRLVASRWVEMDPQHMFDTLVGIQDNARFPAGELQRVLFEEWPKRDVNAVVAALSHTNGAVVSRNWRYNVVGALMDKDVELGLRVMSEWNIDSYGPRMTGVKKWAAANPRHAAEFALAHPAGYASRLVMETIGKEWARTDPASALEFAAGRRGELPTLLANNVLKSWTERNLDEAAAWLAKADTSARNRLSPAFVEAWGKYDAAGALKWCEANLSGVTLGNATASLVKGAGEVDLEGAANLVASMAPSRARGEAATAVMEKWLPAYSSNKPTPAEATQWLARMDAETIQRVIGQVQWRWAENDPKGFAAFIASLPPEHVPAHAYAMLMRQMARQNPLEALAWANGLSESHRISAATHAFNEWQRAQPEAAQQWLNQLASNDPRRQPLFENSISSMIHDPRGAERLAALTPAEQAEARAYIEKMPSLSDDRRTALLNALKPR